jgi:hypothetical protein
MACNIQDSSFKDEHLNCFEYNKYDGHRWMSNKDPKDFHLDSWICTLQICSVLKLICCIDLSSMKWRVVESNNADFLNELPLAWTCLINKAWMWMGFELEPWVASNDSWCYNVRTWELGFDGAQSFKTHHSTLKCRRVF